MNRARSGLWKPVICNLILLDAKRFEIKQTIILDTCFIVLKFIFGGFVYLNRPKTLVWVRRTTVQTTAREFRFQSLQEVESWVEWVCYWFEMPVVIDSVLRAVIWRRLCSSRWFLYKNLSFFREAETSVFSNISEL